MNYDIDSYINKETEKLYLRNTSFCLTNSSGLKKSVENLINFLREAMYPTIFGQGKCGVCLKSKCENCSSGQYKEFSIQNHIKSSLKNASELLLCILDGTSPESNNEETVCRYIASIDGICDILATDVHAAYEGDPAASSEFEIMLAYPGFEAISIYRLAHRLHELGVKLVPRMMTEYAHKMTGIDIHPGATIGKYFFIDHGTGVVIGETCVIKDHVKLYQGVTLGALSFKLDDDGNPIKGVKRHPDIGSNVIIYAGATILGGKTVVGDNSIIGSNVWLTHSVESGSKIYYTPKE